MAVDMVSFFLRADRGGGPGFVGFSLELLGSSISLITLRFQTLNFNVEFQILSVLNFCSCKHRYLKNAFLPVLISALVTQVLQIVFLPVLISSLATQILQSEFK
jgi:hypothetical protein